MTHSGDGYSEGPYVAVRVFATGFTIGAIDGTSDGAEEYGIDLVDADGGYSEECWDHYNDRRLDRETAIRVASEFAAENGVPDLPVRIVAAS